MSPRRPRAPARVVRRTPLRRLLPWLAPALVAAAVAAHVWFWYAPRVRAVVADPTGVPARLVSESDDSFRLWFAYPHQNLAALGRAQPEVAELWRKSLPPFALFPAPPSRELAVVRSDDGGAAAARVFPAAALAAKAAGRLAGNPWLGGGAVSIAGTEGTVRWRGNQWTVTWGTGSIPEPTADEASTERRLPGGEGVPPFEAPQSALAFLDPASSGFGLPARRGWWRVRAGPDGLRLRRAGRSGGDEDDGWEQRASGPLDHLTDQAPSELGLVAVRDAGSLVEALFVRDQEQGSGVLRLPSAALASSGSQAERRELELPAHELFDTLGARLREETVGPWAVVATDARSAELAGEMLPRLDAAGGGPGSERWLVTLRPRLVHRLAKAVDEVFETLPVGGKETRERWHRYRGWSEALLPIDWIGLAIAADEVEIRARRSVVP